MADGALDMDTQIPPTASDPSPKVTWKNRMRIAWGCFFVNVAVLLALCFMPVDRINAARDVMNTILYTDMLTIAAYMGTTALPYINRR
jgi:hypothetical protein